MLYSNALFSDILRSENPFVVEPIIVTFREYLLNCVYQIDLKLINRKHILTSFKYIPPTTENFSIKRIIYPKKDNGLIAPGMHAKIEILFNATSLDNFEDEISIVTETFAFRVPLRAIRESPALSLENPMICGKSLLGDQTSMVFRCKNNGGDAHFKFNIKEDNLNNNNLNSSNVHSQNFNNNQINKSHNFISNNNTNSNNTGVIQPSGNNALGTNNAGGDSNNYHNSNSNVIQTLSNNNNNNNNNSNNNNNNQQDSEVLNVGPFSIFPQEFYLYKGMSVEVYVNFNPQTEGLIEKDLLICCDSKINLNHKIMGEGISIDLKIISLDGISVDESIEKLENLYFEDAYPSTLSSRSLKIKNMSSVPLRFHWSIYDMYQKETFSLEEDEDYFTIFPIDGVFEPLQEISFKVNFQPKNSRNYEQKLDLIIEDVPFQAVKNFANPHLISSGRNSAKNTNYSQNANFNNKENKNSNFNNNINSNNNNLHHIALKKNTFTKGEPFMLALNSPYPSYPIFSFNLKGQGKQCYLDVSSKIIDFGVVYIGEKISSSFSLFNPKSGLIKFKILKILQSIRKKASIADSDQVNNVNKFFRWSEPGSTVTDHFRTNCIFKLKKPNENNLNQIFSKINKEFSLQNLYNNNSNNNFDLLSENETASVKASNNNNNFNRLISKNNSKTNLHNLLNDINLGNLLGSNNNNIIRLGEKAGSSNPQDEVDYLRLFISKEFLYKKEREMSKQPRKKWTSKIKSKSKNSGSNKKIYNLNSNNNPNSKPVLSPNENNIFAKNCSSNDNNNNNNLTSGICNTKIIRRDYSHDSTKNGGLIPKHNAKSKQIERITINSAVSKAKEKNSENTNNNINNININEKNLMQNLNSNSNNNLNNLNLQNSMIVEENSFNSKTIQTRTNLAKSPSDALSISIKGAGGATSHSNSRLNVHTGSKQINQALSACDEIALEENMDLQIKKDESLKVCLSFLPSKLGLFKSSIIVSLDDGIPFSIDFKANVIGPKISVDTPCIDFGLFAVNEIRTAKIRIKNNSRTIARFLIKETRFKNISFENYIDSDYVAENEGIIHEPKFRRKIQTLQEFELNWLRDLDVDVMDNYEIKFSPIFGTIQENQEQEITVNNCFNFIFFNVFVLSHYFV